MLGGIELGGVFWRGSSVGVRNEYMWVGLCKIYLLG